MLNCKIGVYKLKKMCIFEWFVKVKIEEEKEKKMKKIDSKYIDIDDVRKMRNFYCKANFKGAEKRRRINVLIKNLEQVLKNIAAERRVVTPAAQEEFYQIVREFFQKCRQEKYGLSYDLVMSYKKALSMSQKQQEKKTLEKTESKPQVVQLETKSSKSFWGKVKEKIASSKQAVVRTVKYAAATGIALLSFGNCNTTSVLQNKKADQEKIVPVAKPQISEIDSLFSYKNQGVQVLHAEAEESIIAPYSAEGYPNIEANERNYKKLVRNLILQFQENIQTLQNSDTNRKKFYSEQERLIGKYGKLPHIVPQSSCESMSYATFLKVLDKNSEKDDYVAQACKDLLLRVPNPHACQSNKQTFDSHYSKNLRTELKEELKQNKYGIYMIWIKNKAGSLHRMTVIGSGDNQAYLMAYNNNRMVKMDIDKLEKIPAQNGYFCDLGVSIKSKANELAADGTKAEKLKNKMDKTYFAFVLHQQQGRQS